MLAGDAQAFNEWASLLFPELYTAAIRRGLRETDAEDAAQSSILAVIERLRDDEPVLPLGLGLRKYVFGVLRHLVANQRRREKAERGTVDVETLGDVLPEAPESSSEDDTPAKRKLRECISNAPARHAKIIRLRYFDMASTKEIAAAMNIKASSVYQTLQRAEDWIERCMSQ